MKNQEIKTIAVTLPRKEIIDMLQKNHNAENVSIQIPYSQLSAQINKLGVAEYAKDVIESELIQNPDLTKLETEILNNILHNDDLLQKAGELLEEIMNKNNGDREQSFITELLLED